MIMSLAPIGVFCLISTYFCQYWFQRIYSSGKIYDWCSSCPGYPVFRCISDSAESLYRSEPGSALLRNSSRLWHLHFPQQHPMRPFRFLLILLSKKIGVSKKISSFTIPLGATINMDGTSIMQGVAVVFAAQAFGIHLTSYGLCDRYRYRYTGFHRYSRCTKCRSCYTDYGI